MATIDVAKRYVALVKEHKHDECLNELFAKDAVKCARRQSGRARERSSAHGRWHKDTE